MAALLVFRTKLAKPGRSLNGVWRIPDSAPLSGGSPPAMRTQKQTAGAFAPIHTQLGRAVKKRIAAIIAAGAFAGLIGFGQGPAAMAACSGSDGSSNAEDDPTTPDVDEDGEGDDLATDPAGRGTKVYGTQDGDPATQTPPSGGYIGVTGPTGYIEFEGSDSPEFQVDGATADGKVDGRVTAGATPGVCVNGQGA